MDEYKSFYKTVGGGEGDRCRYPTRLDMYGKGCQHNCQYCYARSLLDFRGLWHPDDVACADREKVRRKLDTIPAGTVLRLGGMTDPFQPIERVYGHTEWLIGELNERHIHYLIVTKSADVADCQAISPRYGHVQVSYTHTEGMAPEGYEVASAPRERLAAAVRLSKRGIDTQIRLSPFNPGIMDLGQVVKCPVDRVVVEFLRVNTFIKRNFPTWDFSAWSEKSGNYWHLPLDVKKQAMYPLLGRKQITVCEDHPEHYVWFRDNVNPNPEDCCDLRLNL